MIDYGKLIQKYKPDSVEQGKIASLVSDVTGRIRRYCSENSIDADPVLVGSVAKGTNIKSGDIDIFVTFSRKYEKREMEDLGVKIGRAVIRNGTEKYAEHPYVTGRLNGYKLDIVPSYRISPGERKVSSVDRTPLHTDFVLKNLTAEMRDQVILLKLFMKHFQIYGSEVRVAGFSGYICELLTWKFDNFENVIQMFSRLSGKLVIGNTRRTNLPESPVLIIDPVDDERNAAAAVSVESLSTMKVASKLFVSSHDEEYLNPNPPRQEPVYADRGTAIRIFHMPKPPAVDDIIYPQAVKFRNSLVDLLHSGGFMPLSSEISIEGEVQILIECRDSSSPAIRTREGPPADSDNVLDFVRKYKEIAVRGPYIIGERIYADVRTETETIEQFVQEHLQELSIGKNLGPLKDRIIIDNPAGGNTRFDVMDRFYSKRII
ncbi:MAG: CCA tRNA nucleotidyltransferase [Thermoplasmataceae archaeon]